MSEEVDPCDAEIERLRQKIRVKDVHITGLNAEISWRIQLLQNKGNMKPTMNDDLKPQGVPRKLTWDGAMTITELVALRQRDQLPNSSPEWRAADAIALQIREIEQEWWHYTEKNPEAGHNPEITQAVSRIQEILKIAAPQIEPFGGLTNLCLQIDNLVAGQMREIERLKAALRTVAARIDDTVAVGWLGDYRGTLAAFLREAVGDPS